MQFVMQLTLLIRRAWHVGMMVALFCLPMLGQAQTVHGYLVQLKPPTSDRERALSNSERMQSVLQKSGYSAMSSRSIGSSVQLVELAVPRLSLSDAAEDLRRLRLHPDVMHVEPNVRLKAQRVPNDPFFNRLWHLDAPSPTRPASINAVTAWDSFVGRSVTVAVLDSGIRPHPDLVGKLLPGYDMVSEAVYGNDGNGRDADPTDPGDWVSSADINNNGSLFSNCDVANSSWHGTFIAGLIGASANNALGVAGVSWGVNVLPVRVAGKCGALLSDLLDGMRWAAGLSVPGAPVNPHPARIINVSFGGATRCLGSAYQPVIDEVTAAGALVIAAAGNEAGPPTRPADCRNVLTVGAVRADGMKTSYSNFGSTVSFVTTGGSTENGGANLLYGLVNTGTQGPVTEGYSTKQGTSFSAPVAAGVAALVASANPFLSPAQLSELLKKSVRGFVVNSNFQTCGALGVGGQVSGVCNCTTTTCGSGMLDANLALSEALTPMTKVLPVSIQVGSVFQPPTQPIVGGSTVLLRADGDAAVVASLAGSGPLLMAWTQTSGPRATITTPVAMSTTAVLSRDSGTVTFELRLTDAAGRSKSDQVSFPVVQGPVLDPPIVTPPIVNPPTPAPPAQASPSSGGGAVDGMELLALLLLGLWGFRATKQKRRW